MSLAVLEAALAKHVPRGLSFAISDPQAPARGLLPEEAACVARAVEARKREFAAGRRAAREAMAKLGLPPSAILKGDDRAPIWPVGSVGSISHTAEICAALIAPVGSFRSVGFDMERDRALDTETALSVTCDAERAEFEGRDLTAVFSAKEALFKALYPLTGELMEFGDAEISGSGNCLTARLTRKTGDFQAGHAFEAVNFCAAEHVINIVCIS